MQQRGIALLLVLSTILLMSIMLSTTYFYLSETIFWVGNSKKRQFEKHLLLGAEDVFSNFYFKKYSTQEYLVEFSDLFVNSQNIIMLNNKEISYRLIDMTNCFNVNTINYYSTNIDNNALYPWLVLKYILQLNNITSSVLNKIITNFAHSSPADSILGSIAHEHHSLENYLQLNNSIDKSLNIGDEFFLQIAPLFCSRIDNTLLININMLEDKHSKLIQAVLMNEINESDTSKILLSKPDKGWVTVESFLDFLLKSSFVDTDMINKLLENRILYFTHDEYYFISVFKLGMEGEDYQLTSLFHVKGKDITVLRRRFSFNE
ncbi:type II secretion system protein GspK [Yersinia canariae]|uniref:type II secretion system protein GspK n=1 Tax=Yersinia canariae TaxID=2607663 RepID=UPI0015F2EA0B|nr:type II secretion system protein GspK [Yersinia canariae]